MVRSLNKAILIGNLTRDPELRYTPQGTAVCTFGLATNRDWTTDSGEKKEDTEFHNIVAWNKLAEICSQLLVKGRKVYIEGRLASRSWTAQDGTQRTRYEIVANDLIILDSKRVDRETPAEEPAPLATESVSEVSEPNKTKEVEEKKKKKEEATSEENQSKDDVDIDDIPF